MSVSEFVADAKRRIEGGGAAVWVAGEVIDFMCAASGHWYFVLRDARGQAACAMMARQNRLAPRMPRDGDRVAVFASAALYAPRARFQLAARFLRFEGEGQRYAEFARRLREWRGRGWFSRALPLPPLPEAVGVVCSPAGAALRDVLRVLRGRWPMARVVVYPAPAQGEGAAEKIAAMIAAAGRRGECEVVLVCRGGGGSEDLWAYNAEAVVRAMVDCPLPVVTGIGHETDETLADFAADVRCATPTAAAQAAVPDAEVVRAEAAAAVARMTRRLRAVVEAGGQRVDYAARWLVAPRRLFALKAEGCRRLEERAAAAAALGMAARRQRLAALHVARPTVAGRAARLQALCGRMARAGEAALAARRAGCERRETALALLSPENWLARGYVMAVDASGRVVSRAARVREGERLTLRFADGEAWVRVEEVGRF